MRIVWPQAIMGRSETDVASSFSRKVHRKCDTVDPTTTNNDQRTYLLTLTSGESPSIQIVPLHLIALFRCFEIGIPAGRLGRTRHRHQWSLRIVGTDCSRAPSSSCWSWSALRGGLARGRPTVATGGRCRAGPRQLVRARLLLTETLDRSDWILGCLSRCAPSSTAHSTVVS